MFEHRIKKIIDRTFDTNVFTWKIGEAEKGLVALTMMAETNLGWDQFRPGVVGMMNMQKEDLKWLVMEQIRPKKELYDVVRDKAFVDVLQPLESLYEAAEANVAFQAWLVYIWYMTYSQKPNTIPDAIRIYKESWNGLNRERDIEHLGGLLATFSRNARKGY